MISYKLNNSYTVYVNYEYINDCIKASKKRSTFLKNYIKSGKKVVRIRKNSICV